MTKRVDSVDWTLLVGYSREEAEEVLQEEEVNWEVVITSPPRKQADEEELRVIAVQVLESKVRLICASPDWSVN